MHFASFSEFLAMGGYAGFVWGSYALTLILLVSTIVAPLLRRRRLERELKTQHKREQRAREVK